MHPRWLYQQHIFLYNARVPSGRRSLTSGSPLRSQQPVEKIAIVGGGITGLATAYYASKRYPSASISLFESSSRFGGVIESAHVPIGRDNTVVCERGPRTLRANAPRAPVMYDLIDALGLRESLITVPKNSRTCSTRYILYPDHPVAIPAFNPAPVRRYIATIPAPSTLRGWQLARLLYLIVTEPLFSGLLAGLFRSVLFPSSRPSGIQDESVGSFLSRHFGRRLVDNLASAIAHGLNAGDVHRISAKALLPSLWELETRVKKRTGRAGLLRAMLPSVKARHYQPDVRVGNDPSFAVQSRLREDDMIAQLRSGASGELETNLKDTSVFSFRRGIQELPSALEAALRTAENVQMHTKTSVEKIAHRNGVLELSVLDQNNATTRHFTHVIATAPYNHVLSMTNLHNPPMSSVSVMLVTLYFTTPFLNHSHRGFGYLIPNSVPAHQNPEHALGVVFDSDAMPDQDLVLSSVPGDNQKQQIPGTKITVVFGGHWWDGRSAAGLPTEAEGITMAQRLLQRHLGITEDPAACFVTLRENAIPQYEVGHCERMAEFRETLLDRFQGRLRVAGASYRGIGVHDCLFSARSVVEALGVERLTGLECFADEVTKGRE
ncbi:Protoporphyrinogen oxidase [Hypoxylon sp. NC1633]|nr:Protoporphyrinogen oxidase [Hypoxylon sp. NC1633]